MMTMLTLLPSPLALGARSLHVPVAPNPACHNLCIAYTI